MSKIKDALTACEGYVNHRRDEGLSKGDKIIVEAADSTLDLISAALAVARAHSGQYENFCKLRDEMGKPRSLGGTCYPKYSEREAFELAANFIVDDGK